jgi:hypothetical protein
VRSPYAYEFKLRVVKLVERGSSQQAISRAFVTFQPMGDVAAIEVDERLQGTSVGKCVANAYAAARIAPFGGGPKTATVLFTLD